VFTPKDFGLTDIMGQVVDVVRAAHGLEERVPAPA
jgi:(2R)-ethylmalonyl-CoA mutase